MTAQTPVWTQIDGDGARHEHFHARPCRGKRYTGSWLILAVADGDSDYWTCETGDIRGALHEIEEYHLRDGQSVCLSVFAHVRLIDLM